MPKFGRAASRMRTSGAPALASGYPLHHLHTFAASRLMCSVVPLLSLSLANRKCYVKIFVAPDVETGHALSLRWHKFQTKVHKNKNRFMQFRNFSPFVGIFFAVLLFFGLRLYVASLGYNYDMQSFERVAEIGMRGESVYTATSRYNYAPLWFYSLTALKYVQTFFVGASTDIQSFHYWVAAYVSLGDFLLALALWQWRGQISAFIFVLANPLSILLSGYHSAFDTWAILWGFLAWRLLQGQHFGERKYILAGFLLGISLATKHILLFFPIWLCFVPSLRLRAKIEFSAVAYGVLGLSFLPFLFDADNRAAIAAQVLGYNSADGIAFLPFLLKAFLPAAVSAVVLAYFKYIFIVCLLLLGYWLRRRETTLFFWYVLAFVAMTSAMATQYLIIPLLGLWVLAGRRLASFYSIWAALFLVLRSPTNLGGLVFFRDFYADYCRPVWLFDAIFSLYALGGLLILVLLWRLCYLYFFARKLNL
jgi:hypothetical protein